MFHREMNIISRVSFQFKCVKGLMSITSRRCDLRPEDREQQRLTRNTRGKREERKGGELRKTFPRERKEVNHFALERRHGELLEMQAGEYDRATRGGSKRQSCFSAGNFHLPWNRSWGHFARQKERTSMFSTREHFCTTDERFAASHINRLKRRKEVAILSRDGLNAPVTSMYRVP